MFVYTIDDIIAVSIIALILFVAIIFGIALLFARLINWISDKRDESQ
jgi:ABC-type Na+ efflux pump permease subunit